MSLRVGDSPLLRKDRGAFFTSPTIANYLADWAVLEQPDARVLDPTCGEAVFLLSAGERLRRLDRTPDQIQDQLFGVDIHESSLDWARQTLARYQLSATLHHADFFDLATPDQLGGAIPEMDAVIGNPPFIRYQKHSGIARDKSKRAALRQGVRLSNLASSWAALLVHSCGFLKPEGRLAMVLPAELMTVGYAEPIRAWLKRRFAQVHLVMFDRLQFQDATEKVVLVLAAGSGGCDAFSLYYLDDGEDLSRVRAMTNHAAPVSEGGKWTDLLLPYRQRRLFRETSADLFQPMSAYGRTELGIVTGGNAFFALNEATRVRFGLSTEREQVHPLLPPGTRGARGLRFTHTAWQSLVDAGERAWLFAPKATDRTAAVRAYVKFGEEGGYHEAYKCQIRTPWWRPPTPDPPDLFFSYMSHRYPRLISNPARALALNSMHGVRLKDGQRRFGIQALPLLMYNSVTMLGAEVHGRSYGGGILKMEPREAGTLPMPNPELARVAWETLAGRRDSLANDLERGRWTHVVRVVDEALLMNAANMSRSDVTELHVAARALRAKRMGGKDADE